jgi:hypothetical protein
LSGDGLATCQSCEAQLGQGQSFCPFCGKKAVPYVEEKPEPSIAVIMMAGIGGLLAFFGFFFGLIGAIAVQGFLYAAFLTCAIAAVLFLLAYHNRKKQMDDWKAKESTSIILARCSYCGLQNDKGTKKCESCGAPLGPR